jgi:hypothetical protein
MLVLLRRITEHVKAQNWTAVALDFVIVVVGVFIGIQVSNWNVARQDRADEAAILQSLHEEVETVEHLSSRILGARMRLFRDLESAVDLLFGRLPERAFTVGECDSMASSHVFYVGRSDFPSLTRLQNTGRSGIIKDEKLTGALIALSQAGEALDFTFDNSRSIAIDLSNTHADIFQLIPREIPMANAPDETERDYSALCDIEKLTQTPAALNGLVSNLEVFDAFVRDGLVPWTDRLVDVHNSLDSLLGLSHNELTENQ